LHTLDHILHTRTYLVGHRITLADVSLVTILQRLFETVVGAAERSKLPNVVRHYETVVNQKAIKPIVGPTQYVDKPQQYAAPPKEKKESKAPIAAAVAAVKEKVIPKKKELEPEDEDYELIPEEPKAKNPLDLLPKSSLNLEDWKRAYSNLDTRGPNGSLQWFYEKYNTVNEYPPP
jgi:elongation factor 1-gamma